MQSGYAELAGLYYEHDRNSLGLNITEAQQVALNTTQVGMPPMLISRASSLHSQLLRNATTLGFVNHPLYMNIIPNLWSDDLSNFACDYASAARTYRIDREDSYPPQAIKGKQRLSKPFATEFPCLSESEF